MHILFVQYIFCWTTDSTDGGQIILKVSSTEGNSYSSLVKAGRSVLFVQVVYFFTVSSHINNIKRKNG